MAKLFLIAFSSVVALAMALTQEATSITNDATMVSAIVAIIPAVIAAIFVGWVSVIAARSAAHKAVAPVLEKVVRIEEMATKTEAHVNSDKTKDQGTIVSQKQEIDLLREMMNEFKKQMALLAQAKATTEIASTVAAAAAGVVRPIAPVPETPPVLQVIEKNTQDIAVNTSKPAAIE